MEQKLPMNVWVDDVRPPVYDGWLWCKNVPEAKQAFLTYHVQESSLDYDLDKQGDGLDLLRWINAQGLWPAKKPMVHSANPKYHAVMANYIDENGPYGG